MSLFQTTEQYVLIAWRSIQQRGVSSILTGLSMALGVTLMVAVLVGGNTVEKSYNSGPRLNHHLVVGPKAGSPTQLVLYTIFHADQPLSTTLPWSSYTDFLKAAQRPDHKDGKYAAWVETAIPINKGDNFKGYHVVGTTADFFVTPKNYKRPLFEFAEGKNFSNDEIMTGVVGASVAKELNLKVGSKFNPTHSADEKDVHDAFTVVGVLKPTGTPNDRALFINIEGHLLQEGHAKIPKSDEAEQKNEAGLPTQGGHKADYSKPLPDDQRAVTAILIRPVGEGPVPDYKAMDLKKLINDNDLLAQAASTVQIAQVHFMYVVQPMLYVLGAMTGAILVSSAVSILVGFYNSMNERRREIAIFRALGASRNAVMMIMFAEAVLLALLGGLVGWIIGHSLIGLAGSQLTPITGIAFSAWDFSIYELVLIPGLVALAGLVGFIPAMNAYKTDVAKCLTQNN